MDETEKKICTSCRCKKTFDKFVGENTCCEVCRIRGKRYRANNVEKIKEENNKWSAEHSEERKAYRKEYNQQEKECKICKCKIKISGWAKHVKSMKHVENLK